ncbi:uncharacterized protein LOC106141967 [Amyelois transitella]|uniref:uncharacterized protein LOC106141967 n=1 Tax=Amyelois transitella TaxID=680683 RepID=UPI00298F9E32|nr:uncharacterized protein LOC106141967 [Amyelois transitella]
MEPENNEEYNICYPNTQTSTTSKKNNPLDKTEDKPEDIDDDATRLLDGEVNIHMLKDIINIEYTNKEKENNETGFLNVEDNAIRNDVNLSQASLNVLYESNLYGNDDLNDAKNQLERNQNAGLSFNINTSTPIENKELSDDAVSSNNIEMKRQNRKARRIFRNACIDFISDNEDFSPGSSDCWYPCESEESDVDGIKKRKVKKQKKSANERDKQKIIKEKVPVISRLKISRKNQRKSQKILKNTGKSYENRSGKVKESKSMKENPCMPGKCTRRCYDVTDERRKNIFDHYWSLDSQHQRDWIVLHSKLTDIKRKKTKNDISKRNKTVEYFINEGEGLRQVCQKFLINTLDVSQKLLQYTNNHAVEGMALADQRTFNGILKYSEEAKKFAREFIDKLPAVSSHYCRRDSQKLYLPQELKNISNLYRLYADECKLGNVERISEKMFRQIFTNEYNLSFHVPKKDKCVQCVKSENENKLTEMEQEQLKIHLEEKKASYNRFKVHQNLQSEDTVVTSFDLQKVLNTPYGESMLLYYSRKYSMYNLTFYESQTQNGFCYLWGECDAKRGSNEVATCITKYLKDVDTRGKKNVVLYCDACCGQNKNKVVLTAIHHFLTTSQNIQVIQINFLLPGHSYMPVDSMHAVIEREVKRLIVWSPSQWPTYIEAARKKPFPYKVETLEYSDILDWNELSVEAFLGDPIKDFRKMRVVTMKKKEFEQA